MLEINNIELHADDLVDPYSRQVEATAIVKDVCFNGFTRIAFFELRHDVHPNRWYIAVQISFDDMWFRTIVYSSRRAPGLRKAWQALTGKEL
jgi:hypothetical protein